jgi:LPS-assembly protein
MLPAWPRAQPLPATLLADEVTYDRESALLTASGNVEVLYEGRVLRAARVIYDERANEIRAEGPITITDPAGGVLIADAASLTPDLAAGLAQGARLLIADELQLAAAEVRRSGGRYTSLYRTVASTCTICAENPTPTWAIRAERVTQDQQARRIYFENARLEIMGLPVGWVPRLSIPEPGVERASGVLVPEFSQSDIYGFGFKLPYYQVLGPSADATVTPFVTSSGSLLIEGEYRRRMTNGGFDVSGMIALQDNLRQGLGSDPGRGALFADGEFRLDGGYVAAFDVSVASDDSFLQQYDYSDVDRLTSYAAVRRTRERSHLSVATIAFQSLREDEDTATVPFIFPQVFYRRLFDAPLGGRFGVDMNALGVTRADGLDTARAGGAIDWSGSWTLPQGVLASATAAASFDVYRTWDDPSLPENAVGRTVPAASVELRWPLLRSAGRAAHLIEPIAQVAWSEQLGADEDDIPNEDSQVVEFDDTNLFSLSRFPGIDRVETGLRANLGVSYTRFDPAGWSLGVTVGRVVRTEPDPDFTDGTGLAGRWSDFVGAVSLDFAWGLTLVNRSLFDTDLDFKRNEFAMAYDGERGDLRAAYVYLAADDSDALLGPQPEINEFALDARFRFRPNWELRGLWRYDVEANENLRAGAGITYGNECAEFDLSVSRRYTSSFNVPPSTSIGFSVRLAGLGAPEERDWPERVCMGG